MKPASPSLRCLLFLSLLAFLWPAGRADGQTVVAWGSNYYGQSSVPAGLSDAVTVAAGHYHTLALKKDGSVVAWGRNDFGQSTVPAGLANVIAVAGGQDHSLALKSDGTVVAWGNNEFGKSTVPAGLINVIAVAAGGWQSLALKADGTVVTWGSNAYNLVTVPPGLSNVTAVSAGLYHSLALKADGTVVAWGINDSGQNTVPAGLANVIAMEGRGNLALKADGSVVVWGNNGNWRREPPAGLANVIAMAGGVFHSLALKADGSVVSWADYFYLDYDQTVPAGLANVVTVAAGREHSLALTGSSTAAFALASAPRAFAVADFGFHYRIRTTRPPGTPLTVTNLPAGLIYNAASGVIAGTPTVAGTFDVQISPVTGGAPASLKLFIAGTPVMRAAPSAVWSAQSFVPAQFLASGARASFSAAGLPPGTSIETTTGHILGRPAAPGMYAISVTATNRFGSDSLSMTVEVPPVVLWGRTDSGISTPAAGLADVIAVVAGDAYSLALKADGSVIPASNLSVQNSIPAGLANVIALSAGNNHTLALKTDGTVAAWGNNGFGKTTVPAGLANVIAVAAGGTHSLALKADGTVVAWGGYSWGQNATVPAGLANVIAVAAGRDHSLALRADGTVVAWGKQDFGLGTVPAGLANVIAVAAGGGHSLALKADGTVVAWGVSNYSQTTVPAGLADVIAVVAGNDHSLALKADGSVVTWGGYTFGWSPIPEGLTNVIAVAAGSYHSLALPGFSSAAFSLASAPRALAVGGFPFHYRIRTTRPPGTPLAVTNLPVGLSFDSSSGLISGTPAASGTFTVQIAPEAGGGQANLQLTVLGAPILGPAPRAVWSAYTPVSAQFTASSGPVSFSASGLPPGTSIEPATGRILGSPTAAGAYAVTVTATNSFGSGSLSMTVEVTPVTPVAAWGREEYALSTVPEGLTDVIAVAAGSNHSLALRTDGSVAAWGYNAAGEGAVPAGLTNVIAVEAGLNHSLALRADGSVVAWGDNSWGQITVPPGLANVTAIAAGEDHSLALKADGSVVAWGINNNGESTVPAGLTNVIALAAGGSHSLALRADGSVVTWGWGNDFYGYGTVPAGLTSVIAVATGLNHSLALKADGTVVAWGNNSVGQSTVPAGLTNVIAVAAGDAHSLALKADGSIVAWGFDNYSQSTVPAGLTNVIAVAAGQYHSLALTMKPPPLPATLFAIAGQPLSIPGPGAKAGCTYRVTGLPAWLTLDPLTGTLSGTAPASVEAITLTRELRYRAGYTVEEQVLGILPAWYSSYAAWQTHHFGTDATPQSQPAVDADGDGLPNLMEFLTGTDPDAADSALRLQQEGSAFAASLDVLPGMETAATLRAQFSNDLTFTVSAEVPVPSRTQTLPSGLRRLVFEDPAPVAAARRFARLVVSMP